MELWNNLHTNCIPFNVQPSIESNWSRCIVCVVVVSEWLNEIPFVGFAYSVTVWCWWELELICKKTKFMWFFEWFSFLFSNNKLEKNLVCQKKIKLNIFAHVLFCCVSPRLSIWVISKRCVIWIVWKKILKSRPRIIIQNTCKTSEWTTSRNLNFLFSQN